VSSIFAPSSSIEILLQPAFRKEKIFARSNPFPLKPVIFDDIMGITRTADALIESSPTPSDNAQAVCKEMEGQKVIIEAYLHIQKDIFKPIISTFALAIISIAFITTPCINDLGSLLCASSDGSTSLKKIYIEDIGEKPQLST
jgi:hypothetical protein